MRSVRMRLLISHLILVLLLGIVMSAAISNFVALGRGIDRVLEGNYMSISAAQQMQNGLMLDMAGYGELMIGNRQEANDRFSRGHLEFKEGLTIARGAVNEVGEREVLDRINSRYREHRVIVQELLAKDAEREPLEAKFALDESLNYPELRSEISDLIRINRNAMLRESERAKSLVQQAAGTSVLIAGIGLVVAIVLTIASSRHILRPLRLLAARAESIGQGNLDERLVFKRNDELGALANAFNLMSERLLEARRKEQGRLQRAQMMSEKAIESLYDPIIVSDSKGRIAYLNMAAEALFGPSPEQPRTPVVKHIGDEMIIDAMDRAIRDEVVVASEEDPHLIPIRVGDVDRTYRLRVTPMKSDEGELLGAVAVMEDITHLKEVDRLKSEFVGVAAHELRTPVTSLLMSVQLLQEGAVGELTERQGQVVNLQRRDLERLARLTQELLDTSRLEAGTLPMKFESVEPGKLVEEAVLATRVMAEEKGIRVEVELDPHLQPVSADRSQVERVLTNLISNAMRHTPREGVVKVRATHGVNQVTFTIEDNGEGIPKDYLDRIFDRFVQVPGATGGGAGLGLSIAQGIVKAHGGTIWAESELGAGSAFHFTLPISNQAVGDLTS
jgi:two-component system, NtrC family, sensor histidine kinase KinB